LDWLYICGNGGWGRIDSCVDFVTIVGTVASGCGDRSDRVAGGQIDYRWQSNQFVFGLEAQGDWTDRKNTRVALFNPTLSTTAKNDGIGLFIGQLGWAWNSALLYAGRLGARLALQKREATPPSLRSCRLAWDADAVTHHFRLSFCEQNGLVAASAIAHRELTTRVAASGAPSALGNLDPLVAPEVLGSIVEISRALENVVERVCGFVL
jgi:hypothetical protein